MTDGLQALSPPPRAEKAAMIVRLLLKDGADLPIKSLPEPSQIRLTRALGALPAVSQATLDTAAAEFVEELEAMALTATGGMHGAIDVLRDQLSHAAAEKLANEAGADDPTHAWRRIAALPSEAQSEILQSESTEIAALTLSKLPVARAAELLGLIPGDRARRIACMTSQIDDLSTEAAARIARALVADYCTTPAPVFDRDAVDRVADMLNATGRARREEVLEGLDADDADFAQAVRKALFVFANIPDRVEPLDIPKVVKLLNPEQMTAAIGYGLATPGDDSAAAEFILDNLSKRMATQIREEVEDAGTVDQESAEEAQAALIQSIRDLADGGEIALKRSTA